MIRFPLQTVLDYNNTTIQGGGPTSVSGGVSKTFTLPQDTDNIVVKLQASVMAGGVSATLQTTDDGGTTWWDVARTSIVSNANASVTPEWLSSPVIGTGVKSSPGIASTVATGSVITSGSVFGSIGRAGASTLGQLQVSGLPILSTAGRVFLQYTAAVTSIISERVTVLVNSQTKP